MSRELERHCLEKFIDRVISDFESGQITAFQCREALRKAKSFLDITAQLTKRVSTASLRATDVIGKINHYEKRLEQQGHGMDLQRTFAKIPNKPSLFEGFNQFLMSEIEKSAISEISNPQNQGVFLNKKSMDNLLIQKIRDLDYAARSIETWIEQNYAITYFDTQGLEDLLVTIQKAKEIATNGLKNYCQRNKLDGYDLSRVKPMLRVVVGFETVKKQRVHDVYSAIVETMSFPDVAQAQKVTSELKGLAHLVFQKTFRQEKIDSLNKMLDHIRELRSDFDHRSQNYNLLNGELHYLALTINRDIYNDIDIPDMDSSLRRAGELNIENMSAVLFERKHPFSYDLKTLDSQEKLISFLLGAGDLVDDIHKIQGQISEIENELKNKRTMSVEKCRRLYEKLEAIGQPISRLKEYYEKIQIPADTGLPINSQGSTWDEVRSIERGIQEQLQTVNQQHQAVFGQLENIRDRILNPWKYEKPTDGSGPSQNEGGGTRLNAGIPIDKETLAKFAHQTAELGKIISNQLKNLKNSTIINTAPYLARYAAQDLGVQNVTQAVQAVQMGMPSVNQWLYEQRDLADRSIDSILTDPHATPFDRSILAPSLTMANTVVSPVRFVTQGIHQGVNAAQHYVVQPVNDWERKMSEISVVRSGQKFLRESTDAVIQGNLPSYLNYKLSQADKAIDQWWVDAKNQWTAGLNAGGFHMLNHQIINTKRELYQNLYFVWNELEDAKNKGENTEEAEQHLMNYTQQQYDTLDQLKKTAMESYLNISPQISPEENLRFGLSVLCQLDYNIVPQSNPEILASRY